MNLSATDQEILESIKETAQRVFGLTYSHHVYHNHQLSIVFSPDKENYLLVVLHTSYRSIIITYTLPQPIPQEKRKDFYEVFNQVNDQLARIKIVVNSAGMMEMRVELDLFKDPFNAYNFEIMLGRFLIAGTLLLPHIYEVVNGQAEKEEILKGLDAMNKLEASRLKNHQGDPGDFSYLS